MPSGMVYGCVCSKGDASLVAERGADADADEGDWD